MPRAKRPLRPTPRLTRKRLSEPLSEKHRIEKAPLLRGLFALGGTFPCHCRVIRACYQNTDVGATQPSPGLDPQNFKAAGLSGRFFVRRRAPRRRLRFLHGSRQRPDFSVISTESSAKKCGPFRGAFHVTTRCRLAR